ncbi:hypothetical protein EZV77_22215 [Burkholderia thailandensis]|nr:hypothetical protein A8H32_30225 [Burkholderia thailandensis]MDD1483570.1 hypothetical protein [Burkholderia thailandensis]MDD1489665.1 hypothetical protein [Burkholderia thailandensis]MDD1495772.1 hypothetical protein [Burkholderia thailandensis]PJO69837.1 hypothetical protein CWD92_24725 [Burkholderia thailandensis]
MQVRRQGPMRIGLHASELGALSRVPIGGTDWRSALSSNAVRSACCASVAWRRGRQENACRASRAAPP